MKFGFLLLLVSGTALADSADVSVSVESAGTGQAYTGRTVGFTVTAANAGPDDATGVQVVASFPPSMPGMSWTCEASEGASCPDSGSGDVDVTVDLPAGTNVVFTAVGNAVAAGEATVSAQVVPGAQTDLDTTNNAASVDTDVAAALGEASPGTVGAGCAVGGSGGGGESALAFVGVALVLLRRARRSAPRA